MSECFLGQIMMAGFNFAPRGFAQCNGQLLAVNQNQALFSLLGTQYGGNGTTNFALPDMRGRTSLGSGNAGGQGTITVGQTGGVENVTLLPAHLPTHTHAMNASTTAGDNRLPATRVFSTSTNSEQTSMLYAASGGATVVMNQQSVASAGGSQSHTNMQPDTTINFCIALAGIYPTRS
jgi:microcystin-dependent protein